MNLLCFVLFTDYWHNKIPDITNKISHSQWCHYTEFPLYMSWFMCPFPFCPHFLVCVASTNQNCLENLWKFCSNIFFSLQNLNELPFCPSLVPCLSSSLHTFWSQRWISSSCYLLPLALDLVLAQSLAFPESVGAQNEHMQLLSMLRNGNYSAQSSEK